LELYNWSMESNNNLLHELASSNDLEGKVDYEVLEYEKQQTLKTIRNNFKLVFVLNIISLLQNT
jgi:hypothetical protein